MFSVYQSSAIVFKAVNLKAFNLMVKAACGLDPCVYFGCPRVGPLARMSDADPRVRVQGWRQTCCHYWTWIDIKLVSSIPLGVSTF